MSEEKKEQNGGGLFNNPMIASALKALTPEQRAEYNAIGKYMFKTNFESNAAPDPEKEMADAIFYIREGLKSGLHPNDLSDRELNIMYDLFGDEWYTEYGYETNEVPPRPRLNVGLSTAADEPSTDALPSDVDAFMRQYGTETVMGDD